MFSLFNDVIKSEDPKLLKKCDDIRKQVFQSKEHFNYTDPKTGVHRSEKVGSWAKRITSSSKFSAFLVRLIDHLSIGVVLETGTGSGINASCLSLSKANKVITIEGSSDIAEVARQHLKKFEAKKTTIIEGDVKDVFEKTILEHNPDLIFLDADHRSKTIDFYMNALRKMSKPPQCILIHDIYWSKDMNVAWNSIISDDKYNLTIDLFEVGLVFPDLPMEKQHFKIQF